MLKGLGSISIGLPFFEEMLSSTATAAPTAAPAAVPVRAFNVFFGLGVPAPLQREGFDGVLEPLKPLSDKLLIMRNVDQVRADESGINAHFDGASAAFTAEAPRGEAQSGGPSIDQVIRHTHYPQGLPPGMVPTLIGGTFFRRSRVGRYVHSYNLDGTVAATMQERPATSLSGSLASSRSTGPTKPTPAPNGSSAVSSTPFWISISISPDSARRSEPLRAAESRTTSIASASLSSEPTR